MSKTNSHRSVSETDSGTNTEVKKSDNPPGRVDISRRSVVKLAASSLVFSSVATGGAVIFSQPSKANPNVIEQTIDGPTDIEEVRVDGNVEFTIGWEDHVPGEVIELYMRAKVEEVVDENGEQLSSGMDYGEPIGQMGIRVQEGQEDGQVTVTGEEFFEHRDHVVLAGDDSPIDTEDIFIPDLAFEGEGNLVQRANMKIMIEARSGSLEAGNDWPEWEFELYVASKLLFGTFFGELFDVIITEDDL